MAAQGYLKHVESPHDPVQRQIVGRCRLVLTAGIQPHSMAPRIDDRAAAGPSLRARGRLQVDCKYNPNGHSTCLASSDDLHVSMLSFLDDPQASKHPECQHDMSVHVLKSLNPLCEYCGASLSRRASVPDRMDSCSRAT